MSLVGKELNNCYCCIQTKLTQKYLEQKVRGGLKANVPHRLCHLNIWSTIGKISWGGLGEVALLEEVHRWEQGLRFQSLVYFFLLFVYSLRCEPPTIKAQHLMPCFMALIDFARIIKPNKHFLMQVVLVTFILITTTECKTVQSSYFNIRLLLSQYLPPILKNR